MKVKYNIFNILILNTSLLLVLWGVPHTGSAKDFVVTSTADGGEGSLRQAIVEANLHQGADQIVFDIPMSDCHYLPAELSGEPDGAFYILLSSPLPAVTEVLIIDGKNHAVFPNAPKIHLYHQNLTEPLIPGFPEGINLESHTKMSGQLIFEDDSMILAATLMIKDIRLIPIQQNYISSGD